MADALHPPPAPSSTVHAGNASIRRIRHWLVPIGFAATLLLGVTGGWFIHKLVDLEKVPWQSLVRTLVILVILLAACALVARAVFRAIMARVQSRMSIGFGRVADRLRSSPGTLANPAFWLDEVWPVLREGKSVILAWLGVYGTMAAAVAFAALLCQTGVLAVAYLQIDRLDKQNEKLEQQTRLMDQQTGLLKIQNELLGDQNLLSESARRTALLQIVGDVLAEIDRDIKQDAPTEEITGIRRVQSMSHATATVARRADDRDYREAAPRLVGRLAAACSSLRGYRYLGDNGKPIEEPRSPERGFVLRSVVAAGLDMTGLIEQRADFSYAETENAVLEFYRLEPTPLAASSKPGARGLLLAHARMAGISFLGSRLGEANFKQAFLANANFSGSRLCEASFEMANVEGAIFSDADLRACFFSGARAAGADFSGKGSLGDTLMPGAAAFRMADLTNVNLDGAFVASEGWLDDLEREARPDTFRKSDWRIAEADRTPRCYHTQDEVRAEMLKDYRWRIALAEGVPASHGGLVITPRDDLHTPLPTPPRRSDNDTP